MATVEPYSNDKLPDDFNRWVTVLRAELLKIPRFVEGDGSPEGSVMAPVKTFYFNRTGSAGTLLYVKSTDGGNTGWVAYG